MTGRSGGLSELTKQPGESGPTECQLLVAAMPAILAIALVGMGAARAPLHRLWFPLVSPVHLQRLVRNQDNCKLLGQRRLQFGLSDWTVFR